MKEQRSSVIQNLFPERHATGSREKNAPGFFSRTTRTFATVCVTIAIVLGGATAAKGDIIVDITDDGTDLYVTTSGSLNTSGLTSPNSTSNTIEFKNASTFFTAFGVGAPFYYSGSGDGITNVTRTNTFSNTWNFTSPSLVSGGADFGFSKSLDAIWIPNGYPSGDPVSQVLRVSGQTLSSIGINPGEFSEFTWNAAGGGDTIRFQASAAAAPDPNAAVRSKLNRAIKKLKAKIRKASGSKARKLKRKLRKLKKRLRALQEARSQ